MVKKGTQMDSLLLHVTDLDQLVWYYRIESMTVEELRGRLLRTEPANEAIEIGTIWHDLMENPPDEISTVEHKGWKFNVTCDDSITIPTVREIRTKKEYKIDGCVVTLTGKCDGIDQPTMIDHKLSFKPNPESYFGAYQWRAYLDMFNSDRFSYYIYHAKKTGPKEVLIFNVDRITMYRYPGMEDDLRTSIVNAVDFIKRYVPEMINV